MEFCINTDELRAAIKDIERAEKRGFKFCLAVFTLTSAGHSLGDNRASYSDLYEKAHPTDGRFDWGRFQCVSKYYKFKNEKLIPIKSKVRK